MINEAYLAVIDAVDELLSKSKWFSSLCNGETTVEFDETKVVVTKKNSKYATFEIHRLCEETEQYEHVATLNGYYDDGSGEYEVVITSMNLNKLNANSYRALHKTVDAQLDTAWRALRHLSKLSTN